MIKYIQNERIKDEFDQIHPQSVIAIHKIAEVETTKKTRILTANYEHNKYDEETEEDSEIGLTAAYYCNYWSTIGHKNMKRRARPLYNPESGYQDNIFDVDIADFEGVYNSTNGTHEQKMVAVAEAHFRTKVLPKLR